MTSGTRDHFLKEASALKMRAMRLRAFGDAGDQDAAILLLRQAARKEIRALEGQAEASPQADAGTRIEACALFLEGLDPVRAAGEWKRLPRWIFVSETGAAMLDRLKPIYTDTIARFADSWCSLGERPGAAPDPDKVRADRISSLLASFGGVAELWWALGLSASSESEADCARCRALELEPTFSDDFVARRAWACIHTMVLRTVSITT